MQGDLPKELEQQAAAMLGAHRDLVHTWEKASTGVRLNFPARSEEGFAVAIEAEPRALRVHGHGFHTHFDWQATAADAVRHALALVRDLLSPSMRVRELRAGDRPYRWELQAYEGGTWVRKEVTIHLFWNYFAPRTVRVFQNRMLPSRSEPSHVR